MPSFKSGSKKRSGGRKSAASKKGSLSLDFVQDLVDESLAANGIVNEKQIGDEECGSDAEADKSGDEDEQSYVSLASMHAIPISLAQQN